MQNIITLSDATSYDKLKFMLIYSFRSFDKLNLFNIIFNLFIIDRSVKPDVLPSSVYICDFPALLRSLL